MMLRLFTLLLGLASVLPVHAKAPKPNFIVINIDDLGYADIGPFGSKLNRTPNLDRLASEGVLFTNATANCPVCTRRAKATDDWKAAFAVTNWPPRCSWLRLKR